MTTHDALNPRKTRKKNQAEKPKIDRETAVPQEMERVYGTDNLNLGYPAVDSEGDSKRILVHCREGHISNK